MEAALFIESMLTLEATGTLHILMDCQFMSAIPAQYRVFPPFFFRPLCRRVIHLFQVAFVACIIFTTTIKLDSNDVYFAMVVGATRLRIYV